MDIPNINLGQLTTFYLVARERNFTAAARHLCLTESAVSQQIKALEASSGITLFNIKNKKIELTEAGQTLFIYAEDIYHIASKIQVFLNRTKQNSLRVGVSTALLSIITMGAVQFQKLYPDIQLNIQNGLSRELVSRLLDFQYDVAIVMRGNYDIDKFRVTKITDTFKLVLVTGISAPIYEDEPLSFAKLAGYNYLLPREGSVMRDIFLSKFRANGLEPKHVTTVQMNYIQCAKMLAEMGKGIALMPEFEARDEIAKRKLRVLKLENDLLTAVYALYPKNVSECESSEEFVQITKKILDNDTLFKAEGNLKNRFLKVS